MNQNYRQTLDHVPANSSIRAYYHNTLLDMIKKMHKELTTNIKEVYENRANAIYLVLDASPSKELQNIINAITNKWSIKFNDKSKRIATKVYNNSDKYYNFRLRKMLKQLKGITLDIDVNTLDIIRSKSSSIIENVELIKSISQQYKKEMTQIVQQSVQRGYNLKELTEGMLKVGNITKNRAMLIARDQTSKINSIIQHTKWDALGIQRAEWIHSSAGKTYRKSHVNANGKTYDIKKGMLIQGEYILPAQKINCRCIGKPIIEITQQIKKAA